MAKKHTLTTLTLEARDGAGTTKSQALRKTGKVPGVVYGHGEPTPVAVDAKQLAELLLSGNRSHIVEATVAGKPDSRADPQDRSPPAQPQAALGRLPARHARTRRSPPRSPSPPPAWRAACATRAR